MNMKVRKENNVVGEVEKGKNSLFPFSLLVRSRKEGGDFAARVFDFGILGFCSSLQMGGLKLGLKLPNDDEWRLNGVAP
ncbi:hypothetical protein VIGAN_08292800 [Vigna angularis var. angularis]|uniref:Uncharacterized protein n=1 Tax=Vigna angularis var. angularis TaxID=157739 RepID=A0A0S3ST90_PHAAN|nr:hypothetical protein VIGAN_08292800 [Vigna angularis var. angularis]